MQKLFKNEIIIKRTRQLVFISEGIVVELVCGCHACSLLIELGASSAGRI